jgi:hypothetical protein
MHPKNFAQLERKPTDLVPDAETGRITSTGTTYRNELMRKGLFPQSVDISAPGSRKPVRRWVHGELLNWNAQQIARRDLELARRRQQTEEDLALIEREKLRVAERTESADV